MHKVYPAWPLTHPAVPPRSRLYHLAAAGVGTEHVESLTSYVTRLAAAHAVPVSKLVGHEIGPEAVRPKLASQFAPGTLRRVVPLINCQSYMLNASGYAAENWVTQLCLLTGEANLRYLTTLCWNGAVSGEKLVRWQHAWCPQCYQGWRDSGEMVREPLLWVLRAVSMCAVHCTQLETRCWNCGRTPHVLTGRSQSGHCGHCQAWLGSNDPSPPGEKQAAPQEAYDLWVARRDRRVPSGRSIGVTRYERRDSSRQPPHLQPALVPKRGERTQLRQDRRGVGSTGNGLAHQRLSRQTGSLDENFLSAWHSGLGSLELPA